MKQRALGLMAFALLAAVFTLLSLLLPPTIRRLRGIQPPEGPLSHDEIVAVIEHNRGRVEYDEVAPGRPVVSVRLPMGRKGDPASTDTLLQYVKGLPRLRRLSVFQTNVTDAGLKEIEGLKDLEYLELSRTEITDAGLESVKSLTELRYLGVSSTYITGAGVRSLEGLTHLETLRLSDTKLTDADIRCLTQHLKGLPSLRYVEIGYNPDVTDTAIQELRKALPHVNVQ